MSKRQDKATSFAMTCNLLSQFIKEKGSLGDLGLGMTTVGNSDIYRPPATMNLLPGVDVSDRNDTKEVASERNDMKSIDLFPQRAGFETQAPTETRRPENSQLTIFYGGKVMVFDNFPADKANDLMMLAGKGCGAVQASTASKMENLNSKFVAMPCSTPGMQSRPAQAIVSDLPIARKASLHRFLEKRKDRISAKAPYQVNQKKDAPADAPPPKMEENRPWLALNPSLNTNCRR